MKTRTQILVLLGLLAGSLLARAQNYKIDWFTVDAGGGSSSGGTYALSGAIGQPDAGKSSGGSYGLQGGFWSVTSTVPTLSAPALTIAQSGGNLVISWPAGANGFVLEAASSLGAPSSWQAVAGVVNNRITVPVTPGIKFYRLRGP